MPIYKVTVGFSNGVFSPTESYITPSRTGDAAASLIQGLLSRRASLLPPTIIFKGVRVTILPPDPNVPTARRKSKFMPPTLGEIPGTSASFVIPIRGDRTDTAGNAVDQARSCLQVRTTFDDDRSSTLYMSLVPDSVIRGEPASYFPDGNPGWAKTFKVWRDWLVENGFQIRALSNTGAFVPKAIANWASASTPPSNIGFVLPNSPPSGITQGVFVKVQGVRRRGTDKLSYNGRYYVDSLNTTLVPSSTVYFLRGTEAGDVTSIKLPGTVKLVGYAYYPISYLLPVRGGVHKRGNSYASLRGRRLSRASLDP